MQGFDFLAEQKLINQQEQLSVKQAEDTLVKAGYQKGLYDEQQNTWSWKDPNGNPIGYLYNPDILRIASNLGYNPTPIVFNPISKDIVESPTPYKEQIWINGPIENKWPTAELTTITTPVPEMPGGTDLDPFDQENPIMKLFHQASHVISTGIINPLAPGLVNPLAIDNLFGKDIVNNVFPNPITIDPDSNYIKPYGNPSVINPLNTPSEDKGIDMNLLILILLLSQRR